MRTGTFYILYANNKGHRPIVAPDSASRITDGDDVDFGAPSDDSEWCLTLCINRSHRHNVVGVWGFIDSLRISSALRSFRSTLHLGGPKSHSFYRAVMPSTRSALVVAASAVVANAATLNDICTTSYAAAALPADAVPGITIDSSSLTAAITSNSSVTSEWFPSAVIECKLLPRSYSLCRRIWC